jgi:type IV pilus assembly protein PilA
MFQRFHAMRESREGGFTLIELLVVIIIIAILAAIAIPVFLRQREKGWRAQMQSALKNAATAEESYATQNNGGYTAVQGNLDTEGFKANPDVILSLAGTTEDATEFCISATHTRLGAEVWSYDSNNGEPLQQAC